MIRLNVTDAKVFWKKARLEYSKRISKSFSKRFKVSVQAIAELVFEKWEL